jgi:hypothetical protein
MEFSGVTRSRDDDVVDVKEQPCRLGTVAEDEQGRVGACCHKADGS